MAIDLDSVRLSRLSGDTPEEGLIITELVSLMAGEPLSDRPRCLCPVMGIFARVMNYNIEDDALRTALLKPLAPMLMGSANSEEIQALRAQLAVKTALQVFAPTALEQIGQTELATRLRSLSPLETAEDLSRAGQALDTEDHRRQVLSSWTDVPKRSAWLSLSVAVKAASPVRGADERGRVQVANLVADCLSATVSVCGADAWSLGVTLLTQMGQIRH